MRVRQVKQQKQLGKEWGGMEMEEAAAASLFVANNHGGHTAATVR